MDLDSIEIVAPKEAVKVLITVSNANNVKNDGIPNKAQLHDLKTAFGILTEHTTADSVCLKWEKRFLILLYGIVSFVGVTMGMLYGMVLKVNAIVRNSFISSLVKLLPAHSWCC